MAMNAMRLLPSTKGWFLARPNASAAASSGKRARS